MSNQAGRCPVPGCPKIFKVGHLGIDAHAVSAHATLLVGATKQELYADFKCKHPRPWPYTKDGELRHKAGNVEGEPRVNGQLPSVAPHVRESANRRQDRGISSLAQSDASTPWCGDTVVGVDFAGPKEAGQQQRKILAVAARKIGPGTYVVTADGFNERLVQNGPPGWTAMDLAAALKGPYRAGLVAMDFPFSLPAELIADAEFAERVSYPEAFGSWHTLNRFIAERLPLSCPTDLSPFIRWRDKALWLLRATDMPARAQPALKHKFQVLFNMTLLGNALLARLSIKGGYRVEPFEAETGQSGTLIEIYPGATMRRLGVPNYKQDPKRAIDAILEFCKKQGIAIDVDSRILTRCETYGMDRTKPDPDGSDALIALCTAILYAEGRCQRLLEDPLDDRVGVEGAIWAPMMPV